MRGLLVGRFQPFHSGHLAVVREIRLRRPKERLILGIGTAQTSHTVENPFTAGERFEMIVRALDEAGLDGCEVVPLFDIDRHAVWVAHLRSVLPPFDRVYTNNPLTRALFEAEGFSVESPELVDRERLQGTVIRRAIAAEASWSPAVPPAVAAYLREIHGPERLRMLSSSDANALGGTQR